MRALRVFQGLTLRVLWLAAAAILAGPPAALAHELGTTRVVAALSPDNPYTIEVTTDAGVLLARLERAQGQPRTSAVSAADLQRGFDALCDEVPKHLSIAFDGVADVPRATCLVDDSVGVADGDVNPLGVTVILRGDTPPGARTFGWRYDLTFASYALLLKLPTRRDETVWLEGGEESPSVRLADSAPPARWALARNYFALGFRHILPKGLDHILFVLGLTLLGRRLRPILWQVSAFTVAHSMTLGLTLYGAISLSPAIVEPMIALSIVYVAAENLTTAELKPWRVALVFAFGLLHGMGFAGVLRELALPRTEFLTGLLAFNTGVEAGQLTVILAAFLAVGSWARNREGYRRLVVVPGSTAIALVGLFWTVQRIAL